ncbi:Oidioi.mRNA.OKI2018_I69.YSR.g17201.t1.cds [Oikopleura dioica]|uniref:Oidioi.mRNA.OKI2018_I69.YSR.g17201.t1.cds n=1 Tax=Oikopleura dioica TaxID=34765 RepID=A0ABN7SIH4_OIKDI|nr:Oidioi.mRNA.OKI2018_I69.YSR.g17201.t1.cds [Oikopleura dioica]
MSNTTLNQIFVWMQPYDSKKRFLQFCLTYSLGHTVSLCRIPEDQKTILIRQYLSDCENLLFSSSNWSTSLPIPVMTLTTPTQEVNICSLLEFTGKSLLYRHLSQETYDDNHILTSFDKFNRCRNLWKKFRDITIPELQLIANKAKRLNADYLRELGINAQIPCNLPPGTNNEQTTRFHPTNNNEQNPETSVNYELVPISDDEQQTDLPKVTDDVTGQTFEDMFHPPPLDNQIPTASNDTGSTMDDILRNVSASCLDWLKPYVEMSNDRSADKSNENATSQSTFNSSPSQIMNDADQLINGNLWNNYSESSPESWPGYTSSDSD